MLIKLLLTIAIMFLLVVMWVLVQFGWRRLFAEYMQDDDVLAARSGCGSGCGCFVICQKKRLGHTPQAENGTYPARGQSPK